jgi:hypothetical protein
LCATALAAGITGDSARAAHTGAIEGVVVNRASGRPAEGVRVRLAGGGGGAGQVTRDRVTDERGRFEFRGLPTGADRFYAIDARHDGGLFAGGVVQLPANTEDSPVVDTRLSVWPTTTDPASIVVARDMLFVVPNDDGVGVVESVRVNNVSDRAYIGRIAEQTRGGLGRTAEQTRGGLGRTAEEAAPGASPTLAFALPAGADLSGVRIIDATIDIPRIRASELGFVTTVAIPPGVTSVTFTYPLTGATGRFDLTRRALYPTVDYAVHAAPPLVLSSDALETTGRVEIGGQTYTRYEAPEPLEAGDVAEALAIAEATRDPVLVAGVAALAAALTLALALALWRRRRADRGSLRRRPSQVDVSPQAADELVTAIAELDLAHESGALGRDEWSARRQELKQRLAGLQESQATP